jgi:KaiC/GvpD/RAD55 family RecA-like ATPase
MGWEDISKYIEKGKLVFIDASGKKFSEYIVDELPEFVEKWQGGVTSRIVIDPLTPVIWAVKDQYEQRELMCLLLRELRKIGTVLCTLEEHGTIGNLSGNEAVIPMYLADCVIHLKYKKGDDTVCGVLKIIKCRNSRHSRKFHAYDIIRGLGVVIIEHNYSRKSGDDRVRESSKSLLKSKLSKLPPLQRKYIDHVLKNLTSTDLKSIELHELISDILEEYESEL